MCQSREIFYLVSKKLSTIFVRYYGNIEKYNLMLYASFPRRRESSVFKAFVDPRFRKDDRRNDSSTGSLFVL